MTIYKSKTHAQFPNIDRTLLTMANNEIVQSRGKITTRLSLLTRTMQILCSARTWQKSQKFDLQTKHGIACILHHSTLCQSPNLAEK